MDIAGLTEVMNEFVEAKGWLGPDSPRPQTDHNLALALTVECGEVLELFEWEQAPSTDRLAGELADVLLYLLQLAHIRGIDLEAATLEKLETNYGRDWTGS